MTYKSTERAAAFLGRTASSSTKPFATGRVEVLPPHARPEEQTFRTLMEQEQAAARQHEIVMAQIQRIAARLGDPLAPRQRRALLVEKEALEEQASHIASTMEDLRGRAKAAGADSWLATFYAAASAMLSQEVFEKLRDATKEIMGRDISEGPVLSTVPAVYERHVTVKEPKAIRKARARAELRMRSQAMPSSPAWLPEGTDHEDMEGRLRAAMDLFKPKTDRE